MWPKIKGLSMKTQKPTPPSPPFKDIIMATRGSLLALWQAEYVKEFLTPYGLETHLHIVKTTGDKIQDRSLQEIGGKGVFIKELEEELLSNKAHIAVHSLK